MSLGYEANPNEVIERVRGLGNTFVRGNHDRLCCGEISLEEFSPMAARAGSWTQKVLAPEHVNWLRSMAAGPLVPGGSGVSCMHGSYRDEDEYLSSLYDAGPSLRLSPTRINFFGHTHLQGGFAANDMEWFELHPVYASDDEQDASELVLSSGARYFINPGSVGQPRDRDWRAAFAIYDDRQMTVEYHRVPYDFRTAQKRILRAGLPDLLATRLGQGR